jgi:hypothetical protein
MALSLISEPDRVVGSVRMDFDRSRYLSVTVVQDIVGKRLINVD